MPVLNWLNKDEAINGVVNCQYRLLTEVPDLSYGDKDSGNLLVQGDNLEALKALIPHYAGQVKCIFIDPPYNTGNAFEHYDDNLEHSIWLSLMYPRLELLRELLAEDGSIWVTIDDEEAHYLKVIMDEVFGRKNFVMNFVWNHRKSVQSDISISMSHNHILLYQKGKNTKFNRLEIDDSLFFNPDNDSRGKWKVTPFDAPNIRENLTYEIENPNTGEKYLPPKGRHWRTTRDEYLKLLADSRIVFGKTGKSRPQQKLFLVDSQEKGKSIKTWWDDCGTATEATKEQQKIFESKFSTPKPERLLERILHIATNNDDLVLDSFLGSGTTAAVAHKMGRRYIGVEIGEHAVTHCVPRLKAVIDGEQGGISKAVGWNGGGGFRFCRLGSAV